MLQYVVITKEGTMKNEELAIFLHDCGFNIIPCVEKRPYIPLGTGNPYTYQHLKTNKLDCERVLDAINNIENEEKEYKIGILLGEIKTGKYQGYYSWAIDIDDPNNIKILKITLKKCQEKGIWFEKSKKGFHLYGISKEKPISEKNHELKLELFGENSFIVVYNNFEHNFYELKPIDINNAYNSFKQDLAKAKNINTIEKKSLSEIKIGVEHGERNTSAFTIAVDYRNKGLTIEETTKLVVDWNKKNNPPLQEKEVIKCIKSAYSRITNNNTKVIDNELEKTKYRSLEDVYATIEKWLYITDRNRIDSILATVLSNQKKGTPVWLFIVGNSGDTKSELINSLTILPNTIRLDQLTKNTLASGLKDAHDLGSRLENKSTILLFADLASLTSLNKDEKKIIWGQFRTLYDGDILKETGSDVSRVYTNCHVTIIAGTTPIIRNEINVHMQLGTREIMYDITPEPEHNIDKMKKAWENENYEKEMRTEIQDAIYGFILHHKLKEIQIPDEIQEFLYKEANRLALLRATAQTDYRYDELINPVNPEVPTRALKIFKRIYVALKSLDENYPDEKAKQIISHIVTSSGDKIRQHLIDIFEANPEKEYSIPQLQQIMKMGRSKIKSECEILWNMELITKVIKEEHIGAYVTTDYNGHEVLKGGKIQEVAYYKLKKHLSEQTMLKGVDVIE